MEQIDYINPNTIRLFGTVIIESLPDKDQKTGNDLYSDFLRYEAIGKNEYTPIYHSVSSAPELDALFEQLIQQIKEEYFHFNLQMETHGDRNQQGMILRSGELYTWDRLFNYTRRINILLGNNLALMMSMCIGGACVSRLDPKNYSPFRFLISAFEDVYPGELYRGWLAYYEYYLTHPNPINALDAFNNETERAQPLFHLITDEMAFDRICSPESDPVFFRQLVNERFAFEQYITNPNVKREVIEKNIINIFRNTKILYRDKFCYRSPYLKDIPELQ